MRKLLGSIAGPLLALAAMTGCGGGSGSTPSVPPGAPTQSTGKAALTFTFRFPNGTAHTATATANRRSPEYLSFGTQSIVIQETNGTGAPTTTIVPTTSGSAACTTAAGTPARTCSTTIYPPVGTDTFTVTAYDTPQVAGAAPAGNALGTIANLAVTVTAGTNTPVLITLGGVVKTARIVVNNPSLPAGAAGTTSLSVFAQDAQGYLIVGPYSAPITITDSDTGATTLTLNGGTPGASVATTNSSDAILVNYSGQPIAGGTATFAGTSTGATVTSGTLTPIPAQTRELVYVGSTDGLNNFATLYDLATAAAVSGGAANTFSVNAIENVGRATVFSLGPQNQTVDTDETGPGPLAISYYSTAPVPASGTSTAASLRSPVGTITYSNSNGSGPSLPALGPNGLIYAREQTSNTVSQVDVYQPGANGAVPPNLAFILADGQSTGAPPQFDQQGNLWVFGSNALDEYAAAAVSGATNGATLTPVTQITYDRQRTSNSIANGGALAFDAAGNIYVLNEAGFSVNNYVFEFAAAVRNAVTSEDAATSEFTPNLALARGIAIEPSTNSLIIVDQQTSSLQYFPSIAQSPPAPGTTGVNATKTVTLAQGGVRGYLRFLH